ncbi:MAG: T9SS type B sorting domain-containing protein [Arcticibacter sp.]
MKERDEIAELFKDRLEHHAEPVDPKIWTQVQSGLAGKVIGGAAAASKASGIIKIIAASSIIVGSAIGVGIWLQSPEQDLISNGDKTTISKANEIEIQAETLNVETSENPEEISEPNEGQSKKLILNQAEGNTDLTNEQAATVLGKEVSDNQNNQITSNNITTSAETVISTSTKTVDSKNNTTQSIIESPNTTSEKNHKSLLESEIPNIFTPNGDGKNDLFNIPVAENVTHTTKVFSQKGELMVEFTQVSGGWDGTKSGGAEAANGTYFYVTFVSDQVGNQKQIKGTINLIR